VVATVRQLEQTKEVLAILADIKRLFPSEKLNAAEAVCSTLSCGQSKIEGNPC
jgi:hypothetical protein